MPIYLTNRTVLEYELFRPKKNPAEALGAIKVGEMWLAPTELPDGTAAYRRCEPNDVFTRRGVLTEDANGDDVFIAQSPWAWTATAGGMTSHKRMRIRPVKRELAAPGEPLRTEWGAKLWDAAGDQLLVPAEGEQDRDRWSGELLVDIASGDPVLVAQAPVEPAPQ